LLRRIGTDLRRARVSAGLSLRQVAASVAISHTQVWRIERAEAPHLDVDVIARLAEAVGHELSMAIHPVGPPIRDAAHVALLRRFQARLHPSCTWRTEVPMPIPGDRRSGDGVVGIAGKTILVEAETRVGDLQEVERRVAAKVRDLGVDRAVLLLLRSRHHRALIATTPELRHRFPVTGRAALTALGRGLDPGGDALILL
jgi:transcriptional regulator with XRE-family HTH domain